MYPAQTQLTGFRFIPTDEELAVHYLAGIPHKRHLSPGRVPQVDLYRYSPRTLYNMYYEIEGMDDPWTMDTLDEYEEGINACYFITDRTKKYDSGHRLDRRAGDGYWRATGGDVVVTDGRSGGVGTVKKTLVYYEGLDHPKKTNWIMQELRVGEPGEADLKDSDNAGSTKLGGKVLCKIYETKYEMLKETKRNHKHGKVCDKKYGTVEETKRDLIRSTRSNDIECEASNTIDMLQHENCRVRDKENEMLEEIERDLKRRRTGLECESSEIIEIFDSPPPPAPAPAARLKQQMRPMSANSSHNPDATSLELHQKNEMLEETSRRTDDIEMIDHSPPPMSANSLYNPDATRLELHEENEMLEETSRRTDDIEMIDQPMMSPAARLNHQQPRSASSYHNPDAPSLQLPRISEHSVIHLKLTLDCSHPLFPLVLKDYLHNMNNKSSSQPTITSENSPDDEGAILNMPPSEESVKSWNLQASVKSHDDGLHNAHLISSPVRIPSRSPSPTKESPDHDPVEHPAQGFIPPPVNPMVFDLNQLPAEALAALECVDVER